MKVKSLKRLPYKIILLFPVFRKLIIKLFNVGGDSVRHHLYDMISGKPPLFFHRDENYFIDTWGGAYVSPVRKEFYKEDWNLLFSIGHDIEVKSLYKRLIEEGRVSKFIDVGANYGLHSMIFLSHGVSSVVFEPNPECIERIIWLSKVNRFTPTIHNMAVSSRQGEMILSWPEGKTWLGAIGKADAQGMLEAHVSVNTLDQLSVVDGEGQLIKIDVEGHELEVLRGGEASIVKWKPYVIFESLPGYEERKELFDYFNKIKYLIVGLNCWTQMCENEFVRAKDRNFVAFSESDGYFL